MKLNVIEVTSFGARRLRARRVCEENVAAHAARKAAAQDDWYATVRHGGDVANAYKYPAETECVLAISDPFGNVALWTGRKRANGVTCRGAAEACLEGTGPLFDERIKNPSLREAAMQLLKDEHARAFPPMLVIAQAASC